MTPFITTFTGRRVNPLHVLASDVDIHDIAHSLALTNRFAGHTFEPISVAQHCVYASFLVLLEEGLNERPDLWKFARLAALLHDGSEAYLGDMTKWMKQDPAMEPFRKAEEIAQQAVNERFQLRYPATDDVVRCWNAVGVVDKLLVRFEACEGYGKDFNFNHPDYPQISRYKQMIVHSINPFGMGRWFPWKWQIAETTFLRRFAELTM